MLKLDEALERARRVLRRKHYSLATEKCYCGWIGRFWGFLQRERVSGAPAVKMEAFLSSLAVADVAASTQNQAFNALLFLYREVLEMEVGKVDALRARRAPNLRQAPARADVIRLLDACEDVAGYPTGLIARLLYECGLRVTEPLNLRRKDVDLKEGRLAIFEAKGGKSAFVRLPPGLVEPLRWQLRAARVHFEQNDARGGPPVQLPTALRRKNATLGYSWSWWWVFPAHEPCADPRSGERVWWRCHEANVQRCVRQAARGCALDGWVTPHVLRHACATHLVEAGVSVRDVQLLLRHASLETTMGYVHGDVMRVPSPLELAPRPRVPALRVLPPALAA